MKKTLRFAISAVLVVALLISSMVFASAVSAVSSYDELVAAIADGASEIALVDDIQLTSTLVLDYDTTINGNGFSFSGEQINVKGSGANVTLKNVKLTKGGDVVKVEGSPNLVLDGCEIKTTATSGNNGALYLVNSFTGTIDVIGNTYLGGSRYALYNGTGDGSKDGVINLKSCKLENTSGGDVIKFQSSHTLNIGNGAAGETALITTSGGDTLWWSNSGCVTDVNFYNGAVIEGGKPLNIGSAKPDNKPVINIYGGTFTASSTEVVYINNGALVNISGGTFNGVADKDVIGVNDGRATLTISGGTFVAAGTGSPISKNNGVVTITGGIFSADKAIPEGEVEEGAPTTGTPIIKTGAEKTDGALTITSTNNSVRVNSDNVFLRNYATFPVTITGLELSQSSGAIELYSAGAVTLDGCSFITDDATIVATTEAALTIKDSTIQTKVAASPIVGTTYTEQGTNDITAANVTEVGTYAEFTDALANKATDILITADFALGGATTVDYSVYINGDGHTLTENQLVVKGSGDVTLKNLNLTRNADTIKIDGSANITIIGGTINCTAPSGNEGAVYITNVFTGTLTITGDANITSTRFAVYGGSGAANFGNINLEHCRIESSCSDGTLKWQSGHNVTIGGAGKPVSITNTGSGDAIAFKEKSVTNLTIKEGAVISAGRTMYIDAWDSGYPEINVEGGTLSPTSDVAVYINYPCDINVTGGTFNGVTDKNIIYVNDGGSNTTISGGTFNAKGTGTVVTKNNGALTIEGGNFSTESGTPIIVTGEGKPNGALTITSTDNSIKLNSDTAFLQHNAACTTTITGLAVEQDSTIIDVTSTGGEITLENCALTSDVPAIKLGTGETSSSGSITLVKSTITSNSSVAFLNPYNWTINKDADTVITDNAIGEHVHTPIWKFDDEYHWQECSDPFCREVIGEKAAHTGENTGDCQNIKVCELPECAQPYGGNNYNKHVNADGPFTFKNNKDGATHTKTYTCCNTTAATAEAHTYDADGYCECGEFRSYAFKTVEETNQIVAVGEEITFTSVADFAKFVAVKVDGKTLVKDTDYTVVSGSTKVTLKADFVNTLTAGSHKIEIISADGVAATTFGLEIPEGQEPQEPSQGGTTPDSGTTTPSTGNGGTTTTPDAGSDVGATTTPDTDSTGTNTGSNNVGTSDKTGDFTNIILLAALFIVSSLGITTAAIYGKAKKVK